MRCHDTQARLLRFRGVPFVIFAALIWAIILSFPLYDLSVVAAAQASLSLDGNVTDENGAIVARAKVSLADEAGNVRTTSTDEIGHYSFASIQPGNYVISVESKGFQVAKQSVTVNFSASQRVDVQLKVGQSAETVTVEVEASKPATPKPIVYNAIFSPTAKGTIDHLLSGESATMRFFIGPLDAANGLRSGMWTVNPKILKSSQNIPLTVTATCLACPLNGVQTQVITFQGKKKRSSEAIFTFIPVIPTDQKNQPPSLEFQTQIQIDVASMGIQYNHLIVYLVLEQRGAASSTEAGVRRFSGPASALSEEFIPVPSTDTQPQPDLLLTIVREASGGIRVQVEPTNAALIKQLGQLPFENGQLRWFDTGDLTVGEVQTVAAQASLLLKAIVDQKNTSLHNALAQGILLPRDVHPDTVKLSGVDRDKLMQSFYSVGAYVYYRLFLDSSPELRSIASTIEHFSVEGRPTRVSVRTKDISFPWQLLHPLVAHTDDAPDPTQFWGFRYEIAVNSLTRPFQGRLPGAIHPNDKDVSLFGAYRAATTGESTEVADLAAEQENHFKSALSPKNFIPVNTNTAFIDSLKAENETLQFLVVYTHGSSGTVVVGTPDGHVLVEDEVQGPRLMFSQTEYVGVEDVASLPIHKIVDAGLFFSNNPIVILNACETGVTNSTRGTGATFPSAFLRLGARGVVATESPVWDLFALNFGNDLIDSISKGQTASRSLLDLRKKYLSLGNPFGILYSYYGGLDVRIDASPPKPSL